MNDSSKMSNAHEEERNDCMEMDEAFTATDHCSPKGNGGDDDNKGSNDKVAGDAVFDSHRDRRAVGEVNRLRSLMMKQPSNTFDEAESRARSQSPSSQHAQHFAAVNASFDSSLLNHHHHHYHHHYHHHHWQQQQHLSQQEQHLLASASTQSMPRAAASWDENELAMRQRSAWNMQQLQQQQQQQQHAHFSIDLPELGTGPSRTGRKASLSNTPVRPRFRPSSSTSCNSSCKKSKLTPAKRLKTPHHSQRRSPHPTLPKTPRSSRTNPVAAAAAATGPHSSSISSEHQQQQPEQSHHQALFAFAQHDEDSKIAFAPPTIHKAARKPKTSLGTHTTAASTAFLLDTTCDDSMDSTDLDNNSLSEPFRFSSFPASLPRIHNVRTTTADRSSLLLPPPPSQRQQQQEQSRQQQQQSAHCPSTVRKRMSFGECLLNKSNDDGTNNTSVSSLQEYGASDVDHDDDADEEEEEENDGYLHLRRPLPSYTTHEDAEDEEEAAVEGESPLGTPVARTRLNFNSVLSPSNRGGGEPLSLTAARHRGTCLTWGCHGPESVAGSAVHSRLMRV